MNRYGSLLQEYKEKYESLLQEYTRLELLQARYNASYDRLRKKINLRRGGNPCILITPNDLSVDQKVQEITGGWSNTSDIIEFWYDVQEIFNWVRFRVEHNYDTCYPMLPSEPSGNVDFDEDVWLFPNETLSFGRGDCEDHAMLLCSMILSYERRNPKFPVECIHLVGRDRMRDSIVGHLAVQISFEGKLTLLDTTGWFGYSTSDPTGKLTAKNVSTEISNYFESHLFQLENPIVYRVFSNSLLRHFNSTDEYVQWMEKR